jgi:hypothetical protein
VIAGDLCRGLAGGIHEVPVEATRVALVGVDGGGVSEL